MALFRSELHVPVKRDEMTFQDRQVKSWEDMEVRMEKRRKEWDSEFESMKNEFFKLKPTEKSGSSTAVDTLDNLKTIFVNDIQGGQKFKVRFDVSEFRPEEIQVRVQDNKIAVSAKHEEKSTSSSVSKEYSRQVDIPSNVDQDKLQCILSKDGILSIEGPVRGQILGKETMLPIQHAVSSVCPTPNVSNGTNGMSCSPSPNNQIAIARPLEVSTNTVKNPIITEPDGTRKLRLSVDVGEFKPEEIVVKTDKKKLIVHAEHEEKLTGRTMHKEFNKEYELPESVDQTAISAYIGDEGKLYIEAPLKQLAQKRYSITQSHDVRKVVVTKESQVTVTDNQNRPLVTINVHRR